VDIDALMARVAAGRGAFVDAAGMAGNTGDRNVRSGERIGGLGVVYRGLLPVGRVVAGDAVGAQRPLVGTVAMAGTAVGRSAFVDTPDMAGGTGNAGVRPGERIGGQRVIEIGLLPIGSVVAGDAVAAQ